MNWIIYAVAATLAVLSIGCFRVSAWHRQEADYWYDVADRVRFKPESTDYYLPLLRWTQAHRLSSFRRARAWKSPAVRRLEATGVDA